MTPLRLTSWFSSRMLPLVLALAAIVAAATPMAFYVQKHRELRSTARGEANRVAEVVRTEITERPRLWRYDAIKLGERLAAEGLDRLPVRIFSSETEVVFEKLHPTEVPRAPLWGRFDLVIDDSAAPAVPERAARTEEARGAPREARAMARPPVVAASVWVAVDAAPLYAGTALLGVVFALLAAGLGTLLYLLPVRAIAGAERRIHLLLGQLALTLQEADRRRIARDLHDGAGQAITAARLELIAISATTPDEKDAHLRIASHLDEALDEVRRSTAALAPPALAELGFAAAIARRCEAISDTAALAVRCEIDAELPPLSAEMELACYRIVQEALTNVARHSGAATAWVRIARVPGGKEPGLTVEIEDDGAGLSLPTDDGRGLEGIRERARLLGGECLLSTGSAGRGVLLRVVLPLSSAAPNQPNQGA